jgi:ATP adenylyltransferase
MRGVVLPAGNRLRRLWHAVEVSVVALEQSGKAHSRMLCEQRLQSFVQKRGIGIWDYRLLDEEPIPDSLRYLVLKAAGGPCQLCGIAARNVHSMSITLSLTPGGKTELANLQALCSKCNRSKRNQDDTDFRSFPPPFADPTCVFCQSAIISNAVESMFLRSRTNIRLLPVTSW